MPTRPIIDPRILAAATKVTAKRPKTVIDHILKHGFITTQELKDLYGYNHPPRAVRDVREQGVPLETYKVEGSDGRKIAAYRFGNPDEIEGHKLGGRKVFSKAFKESLIQKYDSRCAITQEKFEERYLQIDHRIPYEVAGDNIADEHQPDEFMLLSGTAQRQKSWSCEHCPNLLGPKSQRVCRTCYWASPEKYSHMATQDIRSVQITWSGKEGAQFFDALVEKAKNAKMALQDFLKTFLEKHFK